jgi:hypothetical protein
MESCPTIITKMLFVIETEPLDFLTLTHATQLDAVVEAEWFHFDLGHDLVDELHALIIVNDIVVTEDAAIL